MALVRWSDVIGRYKVLSTLGGDSEVGSAYIGPAIAEVEGRLSGAYTVPFSDNNVTARDLAIDLVYARAQMSRDGNISDRVFKNIDARIERLINGTMTMLTTSGDVLKSSGQGDAWSSTEDYPPTHGVSDIEVSIVSSQQLYDEAIARGDLT